MTNDQWNAFEDSMHLAPDVCKIMYTVNSEVTHDEVIRLTSSLLSCTELLNSMCQNKVVPQLQFNEMAELLNSLLAAMYGRLMGLAKQYDGLVTKQVLLEAELASAGK